jgi:hypothetical protein
LSLKNVSEKITMTAGFGNEYIVGFLDSYNANNTSDKIYTSVYYRFHCINCGILAFFGLYSAEEIDVLWTG